MGLTAKQIEAARPGVGPERMSDGNGLYLRVYKSGRKAFQVRLDENGKTRWVTLGHIPGHGVERGAARGGPCSGRRGSRTRSNG